MTYQPATILDDLSSVPKLPAWVTSARAETFEVVAFRSGAALSVLDALVTDPRHAVPVKLLANRLALTAAVETSKLEGRLAQLGNIRDAFHLAQPGEARGPDGDLLVFWRDAARLGPTGKGCQAGLKDIVGAQFEDNVTGLSRAGADHALRHGPLAASVDVMREVLSHDDRAERVACLLSDVVLARALQWKSVLPLSAGRLTKAMLRNLIAGAPGAELVVQQQMLAALEDAIRLARDLAGRAAALRAVAPKLRAKGSGAAVALFLSEDAVAPATMLSPRVQGTTIPMTDRAARRFCDRLVALGVAQELTGRPTFRLYGITR